MIMGKADPELPKMVIDGAEVVYTPGETIYQVADRNGTQIPTLCNDPRLEPFGACRLCVVEIDGANRPVASCMTKAKPGMVVRTKTHTIEQYRRILLELLVSENRELNVDPLRGYASQEFANLVDHYDASTGRFCGQRSGRSRADDDNPFILRDYDLCISCYRCVRVCAEREGDYAISIMNRGFRTQITTEFDRLLADSACTFCGQCIHTCPTGALADRKALAAADLPGPVEKTRTICPYCGVGCSVDILAKDDMIVGIHPVMDGPANLGALCVKGQFAFDFVHHEDRLSAPLVRGDDGDLHETDWDTALERAAAGFSDVVAKHGRHSVYAVASGRAPNEAAYIMQKFMRAGWGTNHIDNCSRA